MTDKDGNALTASDADGNAVECGVTDLGNGMESVTYGTVTEDPVNFSVADTLNTIVPKLVPLMLDAAALLHVREAQLDPDQGHSAALRPGHPGRWPAWSLAEHLVRL